LTTLQLSHISDTEIKKIKSRLMRFLEACSYQLDDQFIFF